MYRNLVKVTNFLCVPLPHENQAHKNFSTVLNCRHGNFLLAICMTRVKKRV